MHNKTPRLWGWTAVFLLASQASWAAEPTADELVQRADSVRWPSQPFTMELNVTDYREKEEIGRTGVSVNVFDTTRAIIETVYPKGDAGRKILRVDKNMWIHIPTTKRAIRITPQQRLIGQVSNGDIMGTNYAGDYAASPLGSEEIDLYGGGGRAKCHKLELTKKSEAATYHRILYWTEEGTDRPIRAEFYTQTGKLLKTAHFTQYVDAMGGKRPARVIIVNALERDRYTVIDVVEYGSSSLPRSAYTESMLSR
jgi:hypothetical protein